MRLRLTAAAIAVLLLVFSAQAQATTTFTVHVTSNIAMGPDIIPVSCSPTGNAISIASVGNGVLHVTVNNAGDSWFTGTFEGTGTVTTGNLGPTGFTASGPVYAGHTQEWFGAETNNRNGVTHATFNFNGANVATGQSVGIHAAFDITINANGVMTVNNFTASCR